MKLRLVKASNQYCDQIKDMLDEWNATGEKIIPYAIRRIDYHDFAYYCENLEVKDASAGLVPDSTFFCLDEERDMIVGAVNIRHYLNESLLLTGTVMSSVPISSVNPGNSFALPALTALAMRSAGSGADTPTFIAAEQAYT